MISKAGPFVAVALLAAVACNKTADVGSGPNLTTPVDLTLSDFKIEPASSTVRAGNVAFSATNHGPATHEFEIFSVPAGVDVSALKVSSNVADTRGASLKIIDEVEDIAPGTTATLTVKLTAGTYALICNLPKHYAQGMRATLTVT